MVCSSSLFAATFLSGGKKIAPNSPTFHACKTLGKIQKPKNRMKKLLIIVMLLGATNLYSQRLGLRLTTSPSFQLSVNSFDFVPTVNYSLGLLYQIRTEKKISLKTGFDFQYIGTKESFPSCWHLTMEDGLHEDYYLIEVPFLFSFDLFNNTDALRDKPFTLGVSIGRILHDRTEGHFSMNYYSLIAGYHIRNVELQSYRITFGLNFKTTRISKCDGLVLSPGISAWLTRK